MAQAKRDFELKKATYDTEVRFLRLRKWKQTLEKLKKQLVCALRRLKMTNFEKTSFYMLPSASAQLDAPHQVNTAKAEAEMAYQLQASKVNARIKEEEMQVRFFFIWWQFWVLTNQGESCGTWAADRDPAAGDPEEGEGAEQ